MRVLILGQAKSGTTALYRSIADALPDAAEVFEPDDLRHVENSSSLVVKHLFEGFSLDEVDAFASFDKRIFLVRDPRDRLISQLLYDIFNRSHVERDTVEVFLDALRKKEAKPAGMSVLRLLHVYWTVTNIDLLTSFTVSNRRIADFWRRYGDQFTLVHYEEMVRGELGPVGDYLGMDLQPAELTGDLTRVVRSSGTGAWRQWFVRQDLHALQPMCAAVLHTFGYRDIDWTLPAERFIDPAESSDYVAGLVERWSATNS